VKIKKKGEGSKTVTRHDENDAQRKQAEWNKEVKWGRQLPDQACVYEKGKEDSSYESDSLFCTLEADIPIAYEQREMRRGGRKSPYRL
jgi:hypothetical protein